MVYAIIIIIEVILFRIKFFRDIFICDLLIGKNENQEKIIRRIHDIARIIAVIVMIAVIYTIASKTVSAIYESPLLVIPVGFVLFFLFKALLLKVIIPFLIQNLDILKKEMGQKLIRYIYGKDMVFFKMKDREFDNIVAGMVDIDELKQKAIDMIGVDEDEICEVEPIFAGRFLISSYEDCTFGRQDGLLRSGKYEADWMFSSDTQLFVYSCVFDIVYGTKEEKTDEYFYRDVTNIENNGDSFTLNTKGGKNIEYITGKSKSAKTFVSAMQQKLREKKM